MKPHFLLNVMEQSYSPATLIPKSFFGQWYNIVSASTRITVRKRILKISKLHTFDFLWVSKVLAITTTGRLYPFVLQDYYSHLSFLARLSIVRHSRPTLYLFILMEDSMIDLNVMLWSVF